ncbi:hypothetical protein BB558_002887 [Smittium angustum]|uniref:Uncharacterized protein n=1 Tax=Smittium angustum TaxID=133377 RepID=A0A2U1J7H5_SMIAN|nr:hypothetical protein BB558_002887 [Smittium angustum]
MTMLTPLQMEKTSLGTPTFTKSEFLESLEILKSKATDILGNKSSDDFSNSIDYKKRFRAPTEIFSIETDYSKVKISNQIPANTFWTFVEHYLRPLADEDVAFLEKTDDDTEIDPVGPKGTHYILKWAAEEATQYPEVVQIAKLKSSINRIMSNDSKSNIDEFKPIILDQINDEELATTSIKCPPLTERILSALIDQRIVSSFDVDKGSFITKVLDERLKLELFFIGALMEPKIDLKETADDEISTEIRRLQGLLVEQHQVNNERKKALLDVARQYLGFQEFRSIIEELDKQIEQGFMKRSRATKPKKRKSTSMKTPSVSTNIMTLVDRRRRVIDSINHLFPSEKFINPKESIYDSNLDNVKLDFKL